MSALTQSVTVGKLFNLSLHWGPCIFRWGAGYLHHRAAVGPERTTERTASHTLPAHNTFHGCSASSSSLLLQAGSTPAPQEVQDLVNLPDMHPESRAFSGQESSWIQGNMDSCTTRFFPVSGGKKIFLLSPLHSILYTLLFHSGGNINFSFSIFSKHLNSFHFSSKWVLASGNKNTLTLCVSSQVLLYTFSFNKSLRSKLFQSKFFIIFTPDASFKTFNIFLLQYKA